MDQMGDIEPAYCILMSLKVPVDPLLSWFSFHFPPSTRVMLSSDMDQHTDPGYAGWVETTREAISYKQVSGDYPE